MPAREAREDVRVSAADRVERARRNVRLRKVVHRGIEIRKPVVEKVTKVAECLLVVSM